MLHIVLLILKILGIILLIVCGLLLALLYAVLFVAVSWRIQAEREEQLCVSAFASWLFRTFTVRFRLDEKTGYEPVLKVRLFGCLLWGIPEEKEGSKDSRGRRKRWFRGKKKRRRERRREGRVPEKTVLKETCPGEPDAGESVLQDSYPDGRDAKESVPQERYPDEQDAEENVLRERCPGGSVPGEDPEEPVLKEGSSDRRTGHEERKRASGKSGKQSKIGAVFAAVGGRFKKLQENIAGIGGRLKKLRDRKNVLLEFWRLEEHRRARGALLREARYLWKKSRPKKIKGQITFGFSDPAHTGLCMGTAGMLCAWYPGQLELRPDFEREILKGDLQIRGKIRCYVFVRIFLRVFFNGDIRRMYRHWQEL